jgi:hypothetical protein
VHQDRALTVRNHNRLSPLQMLLEQILVHGSSVGISIVHECAKPGKLFLKGMQSMSRALRDLEQVLLEGQLAHGDHPVLSMCAANCVIAVDDAGNRKPSKKRSTGRIDGMIGLAMAIGVAPLKTEPVIDIRALIG